MLILLLLVSKRCIRTQKARKSPNKCKWWIKCQSPLWYRTDDSNIKSISVFGLGIKNSEIRLAADNSIYRLSHGVISPFNDFSNSFSQQFLYKLRVCFYYHRSTKFMTSSSLVVHGIMWIKLHVIIYAYHKYNAALANRCQWKGSRIFCHLD